MAGSHHRCFGVNQQTYYCTSIIAQAAASLRSAIASFNELQIIHCNVPGTFDYRNNTVHGYTDRVQARIAAQVMIIESAENQHTEMAKNLASRFSGSRTKIWSIATLVSCRRQKIASAWYGGSAQSVKHYDYYILRTTLSICEFIDNNAAKEHSKQVKTLTDRSTAVLR